MHATYQIVTGPLAWAVFILFFGGIIYRLTRLMMSVHRTENFIFSYMSVKYSLRSIIHWMIPFATASWRLNPALTIVTFVFHFCLLVTPIFLSAHIILLEECWRLSWWALPDGFADTMTVMVILSCLYFLIRRILQPEVRFVTDWTDYLLLAMVALPFVTGFLAYHRYAVQWMTLLHIISGEIMLVAIPFTRLSHMIFSPLTRAYMGSEFGKVRHARDW